MEFFSSLPWICLVLALLYFLAAAAKKKSSSSEVRLLPRPAGLPILGSLLELGDQPHRSLARLAKTHGHVMALRLGLTTTVVASSPAAAREALQKKDRLLCDRSVPDAARAMDQDPLSIIWALPTHTAGNISEPSAAVNLFSVRSLDASRGLHRQKAQELVAYVREHAGRPIDVGRAVLGVIENDY